MRLARQDAPLARQLAVAVAVLAPLAIWWLRRWPGALPAITPSCLFRELTGIACPTCGGTRAVIALAAGRPLEALAVNPLVTLGVALAGLWALGGVLATLVPRWRRRPEASPGEGRRLLLVVLALVLFGWAWLVWRGP